MALESIERTPPPFFRQGLSSLSRLILLGLFSVLLMVADHRLHISQPVRAVLATVMLPLEWAVLQPGRAFTAVSEYFNRVEDAQDQARLLQSKTIANAQRLQEVEQLRGENHHLRQLLDLTDAVRGPSKAVEVLYETSDPYTQSLVIDKGQLGGIQLGSAVINETGVVGQVTRVYPMVSEVTLLTDKDQSIPVINARTGARYIAFGESSNAGIVLELRFVPAGADLKEGDLLTTNGLDGVYPPGLHVGHVLRVDRRVDTSFARVLVAPVSLNRGRHLLVLLPHKDWPKRPDPAAEPANARKPSSSPQTGGRR